MEPGRSLLDHIALIQDLEEALGCKVDAVTEKALKERYKKWVLDETIALGGGENERLLDILEAIERIEHVSVRGREYFYDDEMAQGPG